MAANGRHLYGLCPQVPSRPWFQRAAGTRRTLSALIRLRIGHTASPAHLHRCAGLESPACQCGEREASAPHLYEECPFIDRVALHEALDAAHIGRLVQDAIKKPEQEAPALEELLRYNPELHF